MCISVCARRIEWLARGAWEGAAGKKGRNENALRELLWRKQGPFQSPRVGSGLTPGNELSEETHILTKGDFTGQGRPGGERQREGAWADCPAARLAVSAFMLMA